MAQRVCVTLFLLMSSIPNVFAQLEIVQPANVTVKEGDSLATFRCAFINVDEKAMIVSFKRGSDIISDGLVLRSEELQELGLEVDNYSIKSNFNVGTNTRSYDLSIKSPTRNDTSDYQCVVCRRDSITGTCTGDIVLSSTKNSLTVYYLPGDTYPICDVPSTVESNTSYIDVKEGKAVEIVCSSETGNPLVQLAWTRNGTAVKGSVQALTRKNGLTESRLMFMLTMQDDGAVLTCTLSSAAFGDYVRNCSTLPLAVSADGSKAPGGSSGVGGLSRTIIIIVILVLVVVILIVAIVIVYVTKRMKRERGSSRGHNIEYQPADTVDTDRDGADQIKMEQRDEI